MTRISQLFTPRASINVFRPRIFVRQGLTQTGALEKENIQSFMHWLANKPVTLLHGTEAKSDQDFREEFERTTGLQFTPTNFRNHRLKLLRDETDGFIFYWSKALSVSGGFETGIIEEMRFRNIKTIPILFAVHEPIKTSLLRELPNAMYYAFEKPHELDKPFETFLNAVKSQQQISLQHMTAHNLAIKR